MEETWEKFRGYFEKVERMISSFYRSAPTDRSSQISQNEYMECNRLVFDLYNVEENSTLTSKIQNEFREFIQKEVMIDDIVYPET